MGQLAPQVIIRVLHCNALRGVYAMHDRMLKGCTPVGGWVGGTQYLCKLACVYMYECVPCTRRCSIPALSSRAPVWLGQRSHQRRQCFLHNAALQLHHCVRCTEDRAAAYLSSIIAAISHRCVLLQVLFTGVVVAGTSVYGPAFTSAQQILG